MPLCFPLNSQERPKAPYQHIICNNHGRSKPEIIVLLTLPATRMPATTNPYTSNKPEETENNYHRHCGPTAADAPKITGITNGTDPRPDNGTAANGGIWTQSSRRKYQKRLHQNLVPWFWQQHSHQSRRLIMLISTTEPPPLMSNKWPRMTNRTGLDRTTENSLTEKSVFVRTADCTINGITTTTSPTLLHTPEEKVDNYI